MKPAVPLLAAGAVLVLTKRGRRGLLVAGAAAGLAAIVRRRLSQSRWQDVPPPPDAGR